MKNENVCIICEKEKVFAKCLGCEKPLCQQCALFELIGSGCGCVWPVYYCFTCAHNQMINPNAVLRDPEA